MKIVEVLDLFPTAVMITELEREFSKSELNKFEEIMTDMISNYGNESSKNNYVLEEPELCDLRQSIEDAFNLYLDAYVSPSTDVAPRITQSWLNRTKPNSWHHTHSHSNSYLSGVLYIDVEDDVDTIAFHRKQESTFSIEPKNVNMYNALSWWYPAKKHRIIIFPSHLVHNVNLRTNQTTDRISMAFNMVPKGLIGERGSLNELYL